MDDRVPPGRGRTESRRGDESPWPRRAERDDRRGAAQPRRGVPSPPPVEDPTRPVPPRPVRQRVPAERPPIERPARRPDRGEPGRRADGPRPRPPRALPPPDDLLTKPVPHTPPVRPSTRPSTRPGARPTARPAADPDDAPTTRHPRTPARTAPPRETTPREPVSREKPVRAAAPAPAPVEAEAVDDSASSRSGERPAAKAARAAAPPVRRRRRPRTLGRALLATAASTVAPGTGHLMLHRTRTGAIILAVFATGLLAAALLLLTLRRADLLAGLLSTQILVIASIGCVLAALAWVAVIARTWVLAQPRGLDTGRRAVGIAVTTALCLAVAAPLGFAATLANEQRGVLDELFDGGRGTPPDIALGKERLNLLLVGSDAGPDRTGTRTDTMMVASVETATGRTTLFSLPRNMGHAEFPPGSPMAERFPDGFHDDSDPTSGNYLLNAVYAYGHEHPDVAPTEPTSDPGLNLLHQAVGQILGLQLDYYVEVNMAGFASIIDALGGLRVDVGPNRIPIGGIGPSGQAIRPTGYIEPGIQQLGGEDALAFARSRTGSTDYVRMGRQRCLLQSILDQKSPTDLLSNFQAIAQATTDSVSTNIPQGALPALLTIADGPVELDSVAFDPNLADPDQPDGRFDTGNPDYDFVRQVVQDALVAPPPAAATPTPAPSSTAPTADASGTGAPDVPPATSGPQSVAQSC